MHTGEGSVSDFTLTDVDPALPVSDFDLLLFAIK